MMTAPICRKLRDLPIYRAGTTTFCFAPDLADYIHSLRTKFVRSIETQAQAHYWVVGDAIHRKTHATP